MMSGCRIVYFVAFFAITVFGFREAPPPHHRRHPPEFYHPRHHGERHHPHHPIHSNFRSGFAPPPFGPPPMLQGVVHRFTDQFVNGRWFDGRRSFHDGYGSLNTKKWNTKKWRKERYGSIERGLREQRKNYKQWINANPRLKMFEMFPNLKQYNITQLKRCYHATYDGEEFNPFSLNLEAALENYYKFYPENYHEAKHKSRIQNLYHTMEQLTRAIIDCMKSPRKYRIGFTELSDLSDDEFHGLLGAQTDPKELIKKYRQKPRRRQPTQQTTPAGSGEKSKNGTLVPVSSSDVIAPENKCIPKSKSKLPVEFSWRKLNKTTPAKYQGACGSCWTFAALATIESAYLIKNRTMNINFDLSEQEPLRCVNRTRNGCHGGTSMDVFNYILNNRGVQIEQTAPYNISDRTCPVNIQKTAEASKAGLIQDYCVRGNLLQVNGKPESLSDEDIQRVIQEFGPVYATIDSKDLTFKNLLDGIYENKNCSTKTNHAITIVGWDAESWHIKNSWGVRWGDAGYFRMKRNANMCGIRNYITFPIV